MNARDFLETVAHKCPAYDSPLPDCALASLQLQTVSKEKLDLLTDNEIDDLVRKHFLCVCRKDGCGS
ncbi:MAG: hypothetical protein WCH43_07530 [Verrucomicrobiota bacterium]